MINRMTNDYIATYGKPQVVVSDQAKQFGSRIWQSRLIELGISPTHTSVYHPQSNPSERVMRELGRFFRTYCHEYHSNWPRYVPYIEWVINNTLHEATGFTPNELFCRDIKSSPIKKIIQFPPGSDLSKEQKYIMAREMQLYKSNQRKLRHDRTRPCYFL
ncbi:uncharacterized protein LOC126902085 [Daktulosphaira vitifoliae]|uniref:uncharacterized protein LOC126902085 n=1 Tax=Daktulosphaira vitifoliae TaxID=58002 RepID=UPI0021A9DD52|nr:uncharacterized protein LOC126902085 [Daktulosphaira vitifoliae]